MFDFDAGKLLIVGIVALIFIPSKDLPRVLRQVGQFVGKMKRMASDFQGQFMDAMREADMADLRKEAQKLADSAKIDVGFDSVHDLRKDLEAKPAVATPETREPEPGTPELHEPGAIATDPSTPPPLMLSHEGEAHQPPETRAELRDPEARDPDPHHKAESAAVTVPQSA